MSLLVTKVLLFGELPSLKDQTFLLLLGIHFTTFLCFHSTPVKGFMERYRKSEYRKLVQETFKGYGKGFSLLVLVNKGFKLQIQPVYFIFILVIRGTASSLYKSATLSYLLKKPFKLKKPRQNLIFNTLPTAIVFLTLLPLHMYTFTHLAQEVERILTNIFVTYMVVSRCIRAVLKQVKSSQKKGLKQRIKPEERKINLKQEEAQGQTKIENDSP